MFYLFQSFLANYESFLGVLGELEVRGCEDGSFYMTHVTVTLHASNKFSDINTSTVLVISSEAPALIVSCKLRNELTGKEPTERHRTIQPIS